MESHENPIWPDNSIYFLTDSTFIHFPYFRTDEQKYIVLEQIKKLNKKLGIPIAAYSIAINHYHIKFFLKNGADMPEIKQLLRGGISYEYRSRYPVKYKEMWQTRRILMVRSVEADRKVTGYIIGNLLKHKEVSTFEELKNNPFSSYGYMADKYGEDEMRRLVYSVIEGDESWETF
ncbi:MAG: hypothetical protein PHT51_04785 [Patescibacteria group bacterium]|nr:hypothetical protein [Patescibacteria group bacterium]MDD4610896.1 hypothetical protein [Patescibacteria group bacterium]